jgi:hypothetical protein
MDGMQAPRYQIDFRGLSAYRNTTDAVRRAIQAMINGSKNAVFLCGVSFYGGIDQADAWNAGAA